MCSMIWDVHMFKHILNMDVDQQDEGHKYWINQLSNKVPRANVEDFFRKTARNENAENIPFNIKNLPTKIKVVVLDLFGFEYL